jgi:hypothetical protein
MSKKITTDKNYCIVFSTKNDIELIENLLFEKSAANFNDILMLNIDANSNKKQLAITDKVCKKNNIHWINKEDLISGIPMQNNIKLADDWLTNNNIDVDWILHFHTDCYPTIENFWEKLDYYLDKYRDFKETVGMFGFRVQGTKFGRGCLLQEILEHPHKGWYKEDSITQLEYEKEDYFVVESPDWCAAGINRKLFREHIVVDNNYKLNLWGDDLAYQFMYKGIYNVIFPKLPVIHDIEGKKKLGEKESSQYHNLYSKDEEHKIFRDKWKFWWGVSNINLRQEFNEAWEFYSGTIQEKLFSSAISDGPKTIADIEKLD